MYRFSATIEKFGKKGEKTGWRYVTITAADAASILPNNKKSFRVKGFIDSYALHQTALLPMGEGDFILPLNAPMRKALGKTEGQSVELQLEVDNSEFVINAELLEGLSFVPEAEERFLAMPASHQKYYANWVDDAKTTPTRHKRIAICVAGMAKGLDYGQMIRAYRDGSLVI